MLLRPAVVVIRRVVVALVLSVFVGVTAIAQTTPAWAAQYDVTATITVGSGPPRCGCLAGWNQGLRRQLVHRHRQCDQHHH